jgi:acetyl/propionyl-CoA carboxylase alpha subunit
LDASVSDAEHNLVVAQQALDDVKKDAGVDQAKAIQAITDYTEKLRSIAHTSYYYTVPGRVGTKNIFEAAEKMHEKVIQARKDFDPYKETMTDSSNVSEIAPIFCFPPSLCRGGTLQSVDDPIRKFRKKLNDAEGDYIVALTQIRNAANIAQAQAMLDKSQRDYEKVKDGPHKIKLAAAEKGFEAAQHKLASAKDSVGDLEMRAPYDCTVASISVKQGEHVSAGVPIVQVGNLSSWVIETENLTEIQVVSVKEGQKVSVAVDALPDTPLDGIVQSVAEDYQEKDNDVTYKVKVALPNPDPRLKWGMTVVVTFPEK